ncbi:Putative plasmid partition protein (plasmid) [Borrelia coriaceae ATCC 43381]|uniref:Putative plasmid partition protein n=2 Tax=Borrelia coriaceae TaxID=144 RepID=W5SXZ0_9SPIR|nr:Putative plasmid partition protein [Borrelia coriaceae ATCC 43381]
MELHIEIIRLIMGNKWRFLMDITTNDPVITNTDLSIEQQNDDSMNRYGLLKEQLKTSFSNEVYNRVQTMKILKEIRDNDYYKLDGYKTFDAFIKDYKLAKTQVYDYLRVATAIEDGVVEEDYLLKHGFKNTVMLLRNKSSKMMRRSKINPIKPLRFQLKKKDSYDFYKKNARLTSFILDEIFQNRKDWLNILVDQFNSLK